MLVSYFRVKFCFVRAILWGERRGDVYKHKYSKMPGTSSVRQIHQTASLGLKLLASLHHLFSMSEIHVYKGLKTLVSLICDYVKHTNTSNIWYTYSVITENCLKFKDSQGWELFNIYRLPRLGKVAYSRIPKVGKP